MSNHEEGLGNHGENTTNQTGRSGPGAATGPECMTMLRYSGSRTAKSTTSTPASLRSDLLVGQLRNEWSA